MPFFSGLASGFNDALTQNRQLMAQQQEQQASRDTSILTLVAQQHPDPRVRAQALSTLTQGVLQPAKGGLLKMFGSGQDRNPALTNFFHSIAQGGGDQQVTAEPATTGTNVPEGSMAQPAKALTEPGAATPPPGASASMGVPQSMPNQDRPAITKPVPGPPSALMTTPQLSGATQFEEAKGRINGIMAAARQQAGENGGGADPTMLIYAEGHALGMPVSHADDNSGNRTFFLGNQAVGTVQGVGKASAPQNTIFNQAQDLMAKDPTLTPEAALQQARSAAATATTARQTVEGNRATITTAQAGVAPQMAQARLQEVRQNVLNQQATLQGTRLSNELKTRVLNGQLTAAEAYRFAGQLFENRPGATTDDINEVVGALTSANAPIGAGTAVGTGTPPPGPQAAPVAPSAPGGAGVAPTAATPPPAAPAAGGRPANVRPGGRPGQLPPGRSVYKPNPTEQQTLDTISAARPMMQRVRDAIASNPTDNSVGGKLNGMLQSAEAGLGFSPSDPVYKSLVPLVDHLRVFAGSAYLHGIRNGAYIEQVQDNIPKPTDTRARITDKLNNLDQNFKDIESNVGVGQPGAKGTGTPAPPPSAVPPEVQQVLQAAGPGKHTLSDGSVWTKLSDGTLHQIALPTSR